MIHVTPPMSAPDVVKHSSLADAAGWVETYTNRAMPEGMTRLGSVSRVEMFQE